MDKLEGMPLTVAETGVEEKLEDLNAQRRSLIAPLRQAM